MSLISVYEEVAAGATDIIHVELGREFIHAFNYSIFAAAALAAPVEIRLASHGTTIAPMNTRGSALAIYADRSIGYRVELKKEVVGPPYEIELQITNPAAGAIFLIGSFEVYNSPYPQTRIHLEMGHEGESPFDLVLTTLEEKAKEIAEDAKKGTVKPDQANFWNARK